MNTYPVLARRVSPTLARQSPRSPCWSAVGLMFGLARQRRRPRRPSLSLDLPFFGADRRRADASSTG